MVWKNKDKIMFISSMAIFGTIALFAKKINVSSGELALYRAVLAALIIFLFLIFTKQKIILRNIKKELPLILISGFAMGFNWIFLFEAYKYTTVSAATLSYYFAPIIVTIACPIIFKEKIGLKEIICFIMSTIGIVLITGLGGSGGNHSHLIGILLGLAAASLYATVMIINKCVKSIGGIHRTFIQFLAAIIVLIPYVLFTSGITIGSLETNGWICLLIVGIIHTGITYCMYFSSMKNMHGQSIAILSYIDPLIAILVSVLILNEPMTLLQIIGGFFILIFTLINELNLDNIFKKKNKKIME